MLMALSTSKSRVNKADLKKLEEFTADFGQEGQKGAQEFLGVFCVHTPKYQEKANLIQNTGLFVHKISGYAQYFCERFELIMTWISTDRPYNFFLHLRKNKINR